MVITFFMWLLFWVPHPGRPVPIFEDIVAAFTAGSLPMRAAIITAWAGILLAALLKVRLLLWNLSEYAAWRRTPAYAALRASNNETQLLAAPLTLAMAVNVGFVLGLVFVPGLWTVVEYLFPVALIAFVTIGIWALRMLDGFWGRILTVGGFDPAKNNSFAQLLPAFALSMIGVGLAAPAAMSQVAWVAGISYIASSFFIVMAVVLGTYKLVLGLWAMMEEGANPESAPSLWIAVPILTVTAIALMRQSHGMHEHFGTHADPAGTFAMLTDFLSLQLAFALFGWVVISRQRYFQRFVIGHERSPGSYALICPGVALVVMLQFFINKGLVQVGLVDKFGSAYWLITALALVLQAATIWLMITLNAKHFGMSRAQEAATPAE